MALSFLITPSGANVFILVFSTDQGVGQPYQRVYFV